MPSRTIKPKREDDHLSGGGWQGLGERAPSLVRPELPAALGSTTFLPYGAPALLLALAFLSATARNEPDPVFRRLTVNGLGIIGAGCALLGVIGGTLSEQFLLGQGIALLVLGLLYLV